MFVKTQFETMVNVAEFDKIKIEWSVKSGNSPNAYHIISAVSEKKTISEAVNGKTTQTFKSQTIAQFPHDKTEQAKSAYENLYSALFQGKTAFDMTNYTSI